MCTTYVRTYIIFLYACNTVLCSMYIYCFFTFSTKQPSFHFCTVLLMVTRLFLFTTRPADTECATGVVGDDPGFLGNSCNELNSLVLSRFIGVLGCVAHQQLIHLEQYTLGELKRRARLREARSKKDSDTTLPTPALGKTPKGRTPGTTVSLLNSSLYILCSSVCILCSSVCILCSSICILSSSVCILCSSVCILYYCHFSTSVYYCCQW